MKKIYLAILGVLVLAAIPALAIAGPPAHTTGKAHLHPSNGSGIKRAVITFSDDGAGNMTIHGEASRLSGGEFSLLYDIGSVPGGPGTPDNANNPSGAGNCEPSASDDLSAKQMLLDFSLPPGAPPFVAIWMPAGGGNWTMDYVASGDFYAPLSMLGTVSIRNAPGAAAVKACGKIASKP